MALGRGYTEKRAYVRMQMDCPMEYGLPGAPKRMATCLNLSVGGLLFETDEPIPLGQRLSIKVMPSIPISPPLSATVEVLRVEDGARRGSYRIAGLITEVA